MVDITTTANQALLDAAEWAGVSVWIVIAGIAVALLVLLILVFYCIKRKRESPIKIYATRGEAGDDALEFVEKTLVEFPADRIKIEADKGKIVIKLVSAKPATEAERDLVSEYDLPQEVKGEPLPSKVEEPKPPEEKPPESEPIPMGAVESGAEEKKPKKAKKKTK